MHCVSLWPNHFENSLEMPDLIHLISHYYHDSLLKPSFYIHLWPFFCGFWRLKTSPRATPRLSHDGAAPAGPAGPAGPGAGAAAAAGAAGGRRLGTAGASAATAAGSSARSGWGLIWLWINTYRYIFSGMNIHLPAILMFTRGTRFWHTAILVSTIDPIWDTLWLCQNSYWKWP